MSSVEPHRSGWPEIAIGLVVLVLVAFGGGLGLVRLELEPVLLGLILTALSGVAGLVGVAAAMLLRLRSWAAFGVRPTTRRWLLIGAGVGLTTFLVKSVAILAWVSLTGDDRNIQEVYAKGAGGRVGTLIAATVFLSVLTPVGEESCFEAS